ncbi:hypothetical protein F5Y06DRAFT_294005 [Hypoxylon sp. FL0890]|nr:hypothetical protein F5Y06DRAFT_294005 [Hypoxylon sp. FL0890]
MDPQSSMVERHQSPLLRVPVEVTVEIASYLTTPDYSTLRLVCKGIEDKLFESFARELFSRRQFMFSEFSLQALVDISKSRLAGHLKELNISLERPRRMQLINPIHFADGHDAVQYTRASEDYLSHQGLVTTGQDLELLVQALHNLPKLKTVGLRDSSYFDRCRIKDPIGRTYGAPTFFQKAGYPCSVFHAGNGPMSEGVATYFCHVFWTILRALGKTERNTYPQLDVDLLSGYIPDIAFNIPRYLEPTILPVLEGLTVLYLDLGQNVFQSLVSHGQGGCRTHAGFFLATFLSKTQSLICLRLRFLHCLDYQAVEILQWLAGLPVSPESPNSAVFVESAQNMQGEFPEMPETPDFQHLQYLELGFVKVELPLLLAVYKRYQANMRVISLHTVTITNSVDARTGKPVNMWARFLRRITKLRFELTGLRLCSLNLTYEGDKYMLRYKLRGQEPEGAAEWISDWTGTDWERAAHEVIGSMVVHWRGKAHPSVGDDSDDDWDSDENN